MARLWKILKISLVLVISVFLILAAVIAGWVYVQMRPQDVTAARAKWDANMSPEAADQAALDLVSRMTLDEKLYEMHGSGFTPMMLSFLFRQTAAPVYAGGNERLGIPPIAFTDGPGRDVGHRARGSGG
jgi:hypothetical protein